MPNCSAPSRRSHRDSPRMPWSWWNAAAAPQNPAGPTTSSSTAARTTETPLSGGRAAPERSLAATAVPAGVRVPTPGYVGLSVEADPRAVQHDANRTKPPGKRRVGREGRQQRVVFAAVESELGRGAEQHALEVETDAARACEPRGIERESVAEVEHRGRSGERGGHPVRDRWARGQLRLGLVAQSGREGRGR